MAKQSSALSLPGPTSGRNGSASASELDYRSQEVHAERHVASWQVVVTVFFVLLPLVLMLDFWGDERLTARGRPIRRDWYRQIRSHEATRQELDPSGENTGARIGGH